MHRDYDGDGTSNNFDFDNDDDGITNIADKCEYGVLFTWGSSTDYDSDGCHDLEDDDDDDGIKAETTVVLKLTNWNQSKWDYDNDGCHDLFEDNDDDNDGFVDYEDLP